MAAELDQARIKLRLDLATGALELEAPPGDFERALQQVQVLAEALELRGSGSAKTAAGVEREIAGPSADPPRLLTPPVSTPAATRTRAKPGKSTARPGRLGSFEEVRGLLTEAQEIELRAFMHDKAPKEQPDQVLVAVVKGEQLLGRKGLAYNEIYTLMWLAGVKDLPKALDVVLLRLVQDQMVVRDGPGFAAKFIGRNRVDNDLPRGED